MGPPPNQYITNRNNPSKYLHPPMEMTMSIEAKYTAAKPNSMCKRRESSTLLDIPSMMLEIPSFET